MSSIISLSNSKKDVKGITDPIKRAFIPRLIKSFNPLLSNHFESLKNSSSKLASFDPTTTKKESYLLFTASRFHYFEQYESDFSFGKNIYDDCFKVLGKHLHFRFAEVASEKIVSKIQALNQSSSQPVQQSSETFKVLGDTGVLLELNYKVVHVQLDLQAKRRNWSYVSGEQEQNLGNSQARIYFVAIFFGILAVYLPTVESTEKEDIQGLEGQEGLEVSKKEIQYIGLKRQLMKFIGVKKSSSYYLVFHKFHLLHRLKYREYSDKYLTQAAVKEGFFGSIGNFFKGAAGTIANGISKAVQTASSVVDFYNQNIQPAVSILTPIVSPYLPDNIRSLISTVRNSKENANLAIKETQEAKELAQQTKSSVQQCMNYLEGKQILKLFQKHLEVGADSDNGKEMGVDVQNIRNSVRAFMGTIIVQRPMGDGLTKNIKYPGFLYNKSTILTPQIMVLENDSVRFDLRGMTYSLVEPGQKGLYNYFKIQDKKTKEGFGQFLKEHKGLSFKLDFKEEYSSDECFYQGLINKNIYLAELVGQVKPVLHLQASKAIRSYRQVFYHLFEKNAQTLGGLIFYLDEQEKNCHIISLYSIFSTDGQRKIQDFNKILNYQKKDENNKKLFGKKEGKTVTEAMKNCSSEFLNYNTFGFLLNEQEQSSKELSLFVDKEIKGVDDNADGESLRTQLTTKKITKSSPLELIGIIAMESQSQKKFGVGLLVKSQDKKPLYFLTLKQNVLYEGRGFVYLRKPHNKEDGPVKFARFNFNERKDFEIFEIKYILPYDGFEDYVFVVFDDSSESSLPTTQRQLNTLSKTIVQNTNFYAGYYVEFDLSQAYETKIVPITYRELLETEQSSHKMNVSSKFPENQGIFFAYDKQKQNRQSFQGFYSSNSTSKIVPPPQNNQERIIFFQYQSGTQKVQLSELKKPNVNSLNNENTYEDFQAVGLFKKAGEQKGFGSGSFVSTDSSKDSEWIITAAHVLKKYDLPTIQKMTFHYNCDYEIIQQNFLKSVLLTDCKVFTRQSFNNLFTQLWDQNVPRKKSDQKSQLKSEVDILIIRLKNPVKVKKPLIIDLSIDLNDPSIKVKLEEKVQSLMTNENIPQIGLAGFPMKLDDPNIKTKLVEDGLYYELVKAHKDQNIPEYPKSILQVRPIQKDSSRTFLYYLLSSLEGISGGPVFNLKTFDILGVHNGAYEDPGPSTAASNRGSLIYSFKNYTYLHEAFNTPKP